MPAENPRVGLFTGVGSDGIGSASAEAYAQRVTEDGGEVVLYLAARTKKDANKRAKELEDRYEVHPYKVNVKRQADIDRIIDGAIDNGHHAFDTLFNGAVVLRPKDWNKKISEVDPKLVREAFEVNVMGSFSLIRAVLPGMKAVNSGRIPVGTGSFGIFKRARQYLNGKGSGYGIGKAAETQMVAFFAGELDENQDFDNVAIFGFDPGSVISGINPDGKRTSEDAAKEIMNLVMEPDGSKLSGKLFRDGIEFEPGEYIPPSTS